MSTAPLPRREFVRDASLVLAAGIVGAASSARADEPKPDEPPRPPSTPALILAALLQQYPSERFDEAAVEGVFQDIRLDLSRGRELSQFPLQNADEPATVFAAYRRDRRRPAERKDQPS